MKLFSSHKAWWCGLVVASLIVAFVTADSLSIVAVLGSVIGLMLFSFLLAGLPWFVYHLIGKPMTSTQMMTTITVAWLIASLLNIIAPDA